MLTRFDDPVTRGRFDFNIREADWGSSSEDMEIIGDTWQIFGIKKELRASLQVQCKRSIHVV